MNIVFNLFLYTGILGSTICPEFQLGENHDYHDEHDWFSHSILFYIIMFLQLSIAICGLNAVNDYFQIYFKKHPDIIQNKQDVEELIEYNKIRTLGISIYGFHPSFKHLLGMVLLVVNVAMPVGLSFLISNLK